MKMQWIGTTMTKMTIPKSKLGDLIKELKRMKIRHQPFQKVGDEYEIVCFPNKGNLLLLLKYCT